MSGGNKKHIKNMKKQLFAIIFGCMLALTSVLFSGESAQALAQYGKILYTKGFGNGQLHIANTDGTGETQLTSGPYSNSTGSFSPDGTKIVYTSATSGFTEIYIMNADGSNKTNLSNHASADLNASFSPDGTKIIFTTYRDSVAQLYTMNIDGSDKVNVSNDLAKYYNSARFSPDGSKILYLDSGVGAGLGIMNADGTNKVKIFNAFSAIIAPTFSRDGQTIAFSSNDSGDQELYTIDDSGGNLQRLTNQANPDTSPSYSPDGSNILFVSGRDGSNYQLMDMDIDGSNQDFLFQNATDKLEPSYSPDTIPVSSYSYEMSYTNPVLVISDTLPSWSYTFPGTLVVNGQTGALTVRNGNTLKGSGTTGSVTVQTGGHLAPGQSPGCLSTGTVTISGYFDVEVGGLDACTGYDQLIVGGSVTLSGGILNLSMYNGFQAPVGTVYTIINNDGADAVNGTFSGISEGGTASIDGHLFRVSYTGGDGNDVTLTALGLAAAPNTGIFDRTSLYGFVLLLGAITIFGLFAITRVGSTTK